MGIFEIRVPNFTANINAMNENNLPLYSLSVGEFKALLNEYINGSFKSQKPLKSGSVSDQLIKIKELCEMLKVSRVTVFAWIKSGKIKAYHVGSRLYFKKDEIEATITNRKAKDNG